MALHFKSMLRAAQLEAAPADAAALKEATLGINPSWLPGPTPQGTAVVTAKIPHSGDVFIA